MKHDCISAQGDGDIHRDHLGHPLLGLILPLPQHNPKKTFHGPLPQPKPNCVPLVPPERRLWRVFCELCGGKTKVRILLFRPVHNALKGEVIGVGGSPHPAWWGILQTRSELPGLSVIREEVRKFMTVLHSFLKIG